MNNPPDPRLLREEDRCLWNTVRSARQLLDNMPQAALDLCPVYFLGRLREDFKELDAARAAILAHEDPVG